MAGEPILGLQNFKAFEQDPFTTALKAYQTGMQAQGQGLENQRARAQAPYWGQNAENEAMINALAREQAQAGQPYFGRNAESQSNQLFENARGQQLQNQYYPKITESQIALQAAQATESRLRAQGIPADNARMVAEAQYAQWKANNPYANIGGDVGQLASLIAMTGAGGKGLGMGGIPGLGSGGINPNALPSQINMNAPQNMPAENKNLALPAIPGQTPQAQLQPQQSQIPVQIPPDLIAKMYSNLIANLGKTPAEREAAIKFAGKTAEQQAITEQEFVRKKPEFEKAALQQIQSADELINEYKKLNPLEKGAIAGRGPAFSSAAALSDKNAKFAAISLLKANQDGRISDNDLIYFSDMVANRKMPGPAFGHLVSLMKDNAQRDLERIAFEREGKVQKLTFAQRQDLWDDYNRERPIYGNNQRQIHNLNSSKDYLQPDIAYKKLENPSMIVPNTKYEAGENKKKIQQKENELKNINKQIEDEQNKMGKKNG